MWSRADPQTVPLKNPRSSCTRSGRAFDDDGRLLWTVRDTIHVREEDAGTGRRRPQRGAAAPDRHADVTRTFRIPTRQALLYRL